MSEEKIEPVGSPESEVEARNLLVVAMQHSCRKIHGKKSQNQQSLT